MRRAEPIKWTRELICAEFGMDNRTLGKRLRAAQLDSAILSSKQVFAALNGNIDAEKLRLTKAQADKIELENQESLRVLIRVDEAEEFLTKFFSAARERILSNLKLDETEKDKILESLGGCLAGAMGTRASAGGAVHAAAENEGQRMV